MGINLQSRFPEHGFLDTFHKGELRAVFPSTTAAALTALATGLWPAENGITGWFTHLPGHEVTAIPLRHVDRNDESDLEKLKISTESIIPSPTIIQNFSRTTTIYHHRAIASGRYAVWAAGGTHIKKFSDAKRAVGRIARRIKKAKSPSYTYLYLSSLDRESHVYGWDSEVVLGVLRKTDEYLSQIRDSVGAGARIIVTADHGHVNVPGDRHLYLQHDDPILDYLQCPPSGESRVPIYHAKPGQKEALSIALHRKWGDSFAFVTPDDIEALGLYGAAPLHALTRSRLGSYIGISAGADAVEYIPNGKESIGHIGMHGGLSPDEMRVPLILG